MRKILYRKMRYFLISKFGARKTIWYYLTYFLPKKPRPDLMLEPIEMETLPHDDGFGGIMYIDQPIFSNIDPAYAVFNKWFRSSADYQIIAALEFARRYPEHQYAIKARKGLKYSKKRMLEFIKGIEDPGW